MDNFEKFKFFFAGFVAGCVTFYWTVSILYVVGAVDFSVIRKLLMGEAFSNFDPLLLFPVVVLANAVFFKKGNRNFKTPYFSGYLLGVVLSTLAVAL